MTRGRLIGLLVAGVAVILASFIGVVLATSGGSDDRVVVYTARSHYGEEKPFKDFASKTGTDLTLFGGDASELYERIRSEGARTQADVLITVDAANLWRAKESGLLETVRSAELDRSIPRQFRDPDDKWFGLTLRARTIMRSTKRVGPNDVTTYAGLGDPRWKGKLCLRNSASDYNVSFVADRIAKDGRAATEPMLRRWMANDPTILGSDTDVLHAIEDGRCDVGLTNSYYLGRELASNPDFPGAGLGRPEGPRHAREPVRLRRGARHRPARAGGQAARVPRAALGAARVRPQQLRVRRRPGRQAGAADRALRHFKRDPIDVAGAGEHLTDAVQLMNEVGWN